MASGGGAGVCNKRYRRSADNDGDGETSGRNKRCGVGPSSGPNDDGKSDDDGAYKDGAKTADDGEDYDDLYDDEEAEQSEGDDDAEQRYVVLTEADVRARQDADTAKVAEVLSIPTGFAAVLLRHFKWHVGRVLEEWFTDERRVRGAVGLPPPDPEHGDELVLVPCARSPRAQACGICFDPFPAGRTTSAGCSHYYCDGCWGGYVAAAVSDGARCLSLRCPDPSCPAPVVRELVDAVAVAPAGAKVRARYARFWLRSYVEESGGRIKWCGGAGCSRSVELLGDAATDVFCDYGCRCRHGFCWGCGEEAHRPVSCGTVRAWLAKNASDSETANWVAAHTKRCPKCRRPIEKNQGCNHMTCGAPCRHQFCWLCFDPWDNHRGCTRYDDYRDRDRQRQPAAADEEEARRRQAKASLDRYLYHYERWAGNGRSLHKALADADELERSELERMARMVDVPAMELGFVTEAYRKIADGRRVLRWAHAYAYFLFLDTERDAAKRDLFDDLQSQANRWLECLHGCAELERKELFGGGGADGDGESTTTVDVEAFRAYKEKVANLTGVTRKFMGNLVKAFKTNLPEVMGTPAFDFDHIVNGPMMSSQTAGVGGTISTATGTLEPAAMLPMVSGPGFWHVTPISHVASQGISTLQPSSSSSLILQETDVIPNDTVQEHRPIGNPVQHPVGPGSHGGLLSNLSQFPPMNSTFFGEATSMGLPNIGATPLQVHMSNMISTGFTSTTPSVTSSMSGQPTQEMLQLQSTAPGSFGNSDNAASSSSQHNSMAMDQQAGTNPLSFAMNVPAGLHPNAQRPPPKYVKIWEGTLYGQRQGQPVFISKIESWSGTVSKTVASDWPETMQIVRLIAQEHMNNKQYVEKADFLIFRTLNQHGFLGQLQEKKLCAVIQLPSQTLLLSMSDKPGRIIGMLFPKNMVIFKQEQEFLHHQQLQLRQQQQQLLAQEMLQLQSTAPGSFGNLDNAASSSSQHNCMAMDQQAGINPLSSAMNVPAGLQPNAQRPPPKYVKIWEGTLYGQRQGQPVFISKIESWSGTVSKTVASDWPETMQIVRLIAQEHMNNKQYVGKADFLIFQTLNQHGFFGQLQEKKLCAVIQLPSQTLLLSMSDKPGRIIGMLFPKNMVIFKQEVLTQPSLVQQEKLQQHQEFLHHQQLQLQQQQQQLMQHQQQHMQASTQNLPMQQQMLHQQQLEHQEDLHMQPQHPQYQQRLRQQMQHQQQLRQQIQQLRHQQQHMQQLQMQPQLQPLPHMVGIELGNDDDAMENWVTGAGHHA